jgi:hypothetical protein
MNALITLFIQKLCIRPNENMLFGYLEGAKERRKQSLNTFLYHGINFNNFYCIKIIYVYFVRL